MIQDRLRGGCHRFGLIGCLLVVGCVAAKIPGSAPSDESSFTSRVAVVRPGPLDTANRYQSTVQVVTREAADGPEEPALKCSGSLISPNLVLTAAHCVCKKRHIKPADLVTVPVRAGGTLFGGIVLTRAQAIRGKRVEAIITASDCAKRSEVWTTIYSASKSRGKPMAQIDTYEGAVQAYPDVEILWDKESILWSSSDIAVIFLAEAVEGLTPLRLATAEVQAGDRITLAGYGFSETQLDFGERRFGDNRVSWITPLESGSVEFVAGVQLLETGKPASQVYGGDSGGGCFKAGDNTVLLGINASRAMNAKGEVFSVFTSVYSHRTWLEQQIEEARSRLAVKDGGQ